MREIDHAAATTVTGDRESGDDAAAAALSRAAREAVRQSDPRIDRQLAKMGLVDDTAGADPGTVAARPVRATDVDTLRGELASARDQTATLAATVEVLRGRVGLLGWLVGVEGVAVVVLAALLLLR